MLTAVTLQLMTITLYQTLVSSAADLRELLVCPRGHQGAGLVHLRQAPGALHHHRRRHLPALQRYVLLILLLNQAYNYVASFMYVPTTRPYVCIQLQKQLMFSKSLLRRNKLNSLLIDLPCFKTSLYVYNNREIH